MKYLVVNASPLILLGKIGRLELLVMPGRETITPISVVKEVKRKHTPETLALEYALDNFIEIFNDAPDALAVSSIIGEDISKGEVYVIAKARQLISEGHDVITVLDDRPARKGAQALSIPVTGTVGMVVHAVRSGNVTPDEGIAIMNELIYVGARLDPLIIRETVEKMHSM